MTLKSFITGAVMAFITVLFLSCSGQKNRQPDIRNLEETLTHLCAPGYGGREAGSGQDSIVALSIARQMADYGFEPLFAGGPLHKFRVRDLESYNVVMVFRTGKRSVEHSGSVMLGAHYDHLGTGGPGSGSLKPDTLAIHPGADDNASGVAAVMETARLLAGRARRDKLGKDIIFAAFGAEEKGTLGSAKLADTLAQLEMLPSLMINLDMVGRLRDSVLQVSGTGTFEQADSLLTASMEATAPLVLKTSPGGYGPSDHSVFYRHRVPVLFFTTGAHTDYHTPFDTPDKINYDGMAAIVAYVTSIAREVCREGFQPVYRETAQPESSPERAAFKVSLGVIPDFTYEGEGFCAGTIIKGRPSDKAGMQNGDVVVQINDRPVKDINEYMDILGELEEGQRIRIIVRRNETLHHLVVQL
ncbi:MAG TPA: M28 family peptidase [Bacteroidales bacterium]|nr:M28 family peptidase [Bacteroidales bacterium]